MYISENTKDVSSIVGGEKFRLRLTHDMKVWLFDKASKEHETVSNIIRRAITEYMERN